MAVDSKKTFFSVVASMGNNNHLLGHLAIFLSTSQASLQAPSPIPKIPSVRKKKHNCFSLHNQFFLHGDKKLLPLPRH